MIIEVSSKRKSAAEQVVQLARRYNVMPIVSEGDTMTLIGLEGNTAPIDENIFRNIEGVVDVERISAPYKIVARLMTNGKPHRTIRKPDKIVDVAGRKIGSGHTVYIAGPCAVHSRDQLLETAKALAALGEELGILDQMILRAGAWKPRSNPYSFQGLGWEAVDYLDEARDTTGLPYATEVMDTRDVEPLAKRADMIWVGARTCQSTALLKEVGRCRTPVMLKRDLHAMSPDLWLQMAEYIALEGNTDIVLCERGSETHTDYNRNTLDYDVIHAIKERSNLPIIVDPSHGTGRWYLVAPAARTAVREFRAHGTIIEVISDTADPTTVCDGHQSLKVSKYRELLQDLM